MITEEFVNTCCAILLCENSSVAASVISDIGEIINPISEESIPLVFKKKFQFLRSVSELKTQDPRIEKSILLDSILSTGYFKDISSYISTISQKKLTDDQVRKCVESINKRKTIISISKNGNNIEAFLTKFKNNDFRDIDTVIEQWSNIIGGVHSDILNKKRSKDLHDITELDLLNDSYEPVVNQIELNYSGKNSISTGYDMLDKYTNGGLSPNRLYIFGATSGGGKSVMLINLIKNAVTRNKIFDDDVIPTFVYVTLENLIDETMVRLYCSLTKQTTQAVISNYKEEKHNIEKTIKNWLIQHHCNIKFLYKNPTKTSTFDILGYCDRVKAIDKRAKISAIYVDYLDLLKPSGATSYESYRFELGQVTMDLKVIAVLCRCPVVSATQLQRQAYDPKNKVNLSNVGESMKKVDNADFVGLFQKKEIDAEKTGSQLFAPEDGELDLVIGKNRSGKNNISIPFRTNFSKFLIEEAPQSTGLDIDTDMIDLDSRSVSEQIQRIENSSDDVDIGFL